MFKALVVKEQNGEINSAIEQWHERQLPDHPLLVATHYSSLNYKDGLAVTGKGKILKVLPMIPGIDLAGEVLASDSAAFNPGEMVLLTGGGMGERYCGAFAERVRINTEYCIKLPQALTPWQCMAIGTAGFTAMMAVMALEDSGVKPNQGPVAVSGAAGGVGSMAVMLLARAGFKVAAITGREDQADYLKQLGAGEIVTRDSMQQPARPLETQRWAGAIDNTGGRILARLLAETQTEGAVASCGLAESAELDTSVMPFILRGVNLLGINSVQVACERRITIWQRLSELVDTQQLERITTTIKLEQVPHFSHLITQGLVRGRTVVDLGAR